MAIIASGPSAKKADLTLLRGRARVIAIKQNVDLCPWADIVYGCDAAWWRHRRGLPEFGGVKVCWAGNGIPKTEYPDIRRVEIALGQGLKKYSEDLQAQPGTVGGGGNSGFQAINLALQFGARRIILIGFDMNDRGGKHWYGRNHWPSANNPDDSCFLRWIANLSKAAPVLQSLGVDVVNTSPDSALRCFPFADLETALGLTGQCLDRIRSA